MHACTDKITHLEIKGGLAHTRFSTINYYLTCFTENSTTPQLYVYLIVIVVTVSNLMNVNVMLDMVDINALTVRSICTSYIMCLLSRGGPVQYALTYSS